MKKRLIATAMSIVLLGGQMSLADAADISQSDLFLQESLASAENDQENIQSSESSDATELFGDEENWADTAESGLEEGDNESSPGSEDEWIGDENGIYPRLEEDGIEGVEEIIEDIDSSMEDEVVADEEETEEDLFLIAADDRDGIYSGTDGNISWSVENGTLTISGTGAMNDYSSPEEVPWYADCVEGYIDADEGIITSIVVDSGITSIGSYAFYNCCHMKSITIPVSLVQFGNYAFAFCSHLESITIPNAGNSDKNNKSFGSYVFFHCSNLTSITIGSNQISGLDYTSFLECPKLSEISITSINAIGNPEYRSYRGQLHTQAQVGNYIYPRGSSYDLVDTVIKCPPQATKFGPLATPNTLYADFEIGPYAYWNCDNAVSLILKDTVRRIDNNAFQDCDNLQSINLGKCLEKIDALAFAECGALETITIPGCVQEIGEDAFLSCTGLETIYFRGDAPALNGSIFTGVTATGYYPENNSTWTQDILSSFGGNITWIPYKPEPTLISEDNYCVLIQKKDNGGYVNGICLRDGLEYTPVVEFDGEEKTPSIYEIRKRKEGDYKFDEVPLSEGIHYIIEYSNNIKSGTGTIEISGIGEFSGTIRQPFSIQPLIHLDENEFVYDGKRKSLSITADGDATLYFSTSTSLSFENFLEEGTTAIPSRISAGSTNIYYIAIPNNNPSEDSCVTGETQLVVEKAGQSLSADLLQSSLYIGETAQIAASSRAGAISYASENGGIATVDENGIVTGVAEGQTKITVTAAETANYKEESITLTVTVSPQEETSLYDCEIDVQSGSVYTGVPVEPKVTIHYDGHTLVQDRDFILQYSNNEAPGTGVVKITGKGYYVGSVTRTFEILEGGDPSGKSITDCEITLVESRLSYNGNAQTPEVTVKDGSTVLEKGVDYILAVSGDAVSEDGDAIDTGTYTLSVIGQGSYSGSSEFSFEIVQTEPSLSFEESDVVKEAGDENFRNTLTAVTDGTITFFSEDTDVAEVDAASGEVTIKGVGKTRITAKAAAGKNYLAGETSFNITIKEPKTVLSLERLSYRFRNSPKTFGYDSSDGIPLSSFEQIFGLGTEKSKQQFALWSKKAKDGVCAGIAGSSALLGNGSSGVQMTDFKIDAVKNGDLSLTNASTRLGMNLKTFIEVMHVSQFTHLFTVERAINEIRNEVLQGNGNLNRLYQTILEETDAGRPVVLAIKKAENEKYTNAIGHAILAYGINPVSDIEDQILVYDSNYPLQERVLTIKKDRYGNYKEWAYEIDSDYGTWGTDNAYSSISFISYDVLERIWANKGSLSDGNLLAINSMNVTIYDSENITPVASVINGKLLSMRDDIQVMDVLSREKEEDDKLILTLPVDVYTIENNDRSVEELQVSMTNTNLGTSVTTTARSVTLAVDDSCSLNAAFIDAGETDTYSVSLNSSAGYYDYDNVVVTGMGSGEQLEVSQKMGYINISNCQILSMSIDGEEVKSYHVNASAGEGGSISPEGENAVAENSAIEFTILPKEGFEIADVLLDGKSVGAVKSYVIENVVSDHEIRAVFKKTTGPAEKKTNQISAQNITLISSNRVQSVQIKASVNDKASLSYYSNQPSVKVDQNGKVTVPGNFVGMVSIVIKAAETPSYSAVSRTVTVTVIPPGTTLKKVKKSGSGKATVTWKKNKAVTGYEISYSTSSAFKNAKTKLITKNKTTKVILKKLKKKKYYVRIRTYKTVGGRKYYSTWSKKKTIKMK